jgi:hypothetical protein
MAGRKPMTFQQLIFGALRNGLDHLGEDYVWRDTDDQDICWVDFEDGEKVRIVLKVMHGGHDGKK